MIPKIIHLCWLSGDEYPESIKKCIDSWNKYLPDYEIYVWDTKRFDINSLRWTKEAFEAKKYAFAADYIRLYALYHHGGIYLDSDVIVYKSFNDLLELPYFLGEDRVHCFEPAIIGAEKGCPWLLDVMKRYENRAFIKNDGTYDMRGLPYVFHDQLTPKYKFSLIKEKEDFQKQEGVINIFTYDYFNSRDFIAAKQYPKSYCSHNYIGSWLKKEKNGLKIKLKEKTPRVITNFIYGVKYHIQDKKNLSAIQIPYSDKI